MILKHLPHPTSICAVTDSPTSARLGPYLLMTGTAALLVIAVPETRNAIPWGWFHKAIPVWLLLTLSWMGLGVRLLWQADYPDSGAKLGPAGPRFRHVVLYTRDNCPLCEEAHSLLNEYAKYLPPIVVIDISKDDDLTKTHGTWIPVIEIDGRIRFRGRVSESLLRRMIRMASPTE